MDLSYMNYLVHHFKGVTRLFVFAYDATKNDKAVIKSNKKIFSFNSKD